MENSHHPGNDETPVIPSNPTCFNCGVILTHEPRKTPMCDECRIAFIKYPIPRKIIFFGAGVGIVLLFSMINLSENFKTGLHYKRGLVASASHNYNTAMKELSYVVDKQPGFIEAKCELLAAAYYTTDLATIAKTASELSGQPVEDAELFRRTDYLLNKCQQLFASDTLMGLLAIYGSIDNIPWHIRASYITTFSDDVYALVILANHYLNEDSLVLADSLLNLTLHISPDYLPALLLKTPVKRELLQFDSAYIYCDKTLALNRESITGNVGYIRTLLKEKRDGEALKEAERLYNKNKEDGYVMVTLGLAYHFNNQHTKRDAIMRNARADSTSTSQWDYITDIITGKEIFRK